jgi:hypothetical protein
MRRNCRCGKFMRLVWQDGDRRGYSRQDWECRCGRKECLETYPEPSEPDPDAWWDSRHDR